MDAIKKSECDSVFTLALSTCPGSMDRSQRLANSEGGNVIEHSPK